MCARPGTPATGGEPTSVGVGYDARVPDSGDRNGTQAAKQSAPSAAGASGRTTGRLHPSRTSSPAGGQPSRRSIHADGGPAGPAKSTSGWPPYIRGREFLNGPVDLTWLRRTYCLRGAATAVANELMFRRGMADGPGPVSLNQAEVSRKTGLSEKVVRTAVGTLESARLVSVERLAGQKLRVTLLGLDDLGSDPPPCPAVESPPTLPSFATTDSVPAGKTQVVDARARVLSLGDLLARARGPQRESCLQKVCTAFRELIKGGLLEHEVAVLCIADACIDNGTLPSMDCSSPVALEFAAQKLGSWLPAA